MTEFSPLSWSLKSFYDLFLRNADMKDVLPNVFKIMMFGTGSYIIGFAYKAWKKVK